MMKTCPKCLQSLPLDEFHKNKERKDGLSFRCKKCTREDRKAYEMLHKEEIKQRRKQRGYDWPGRKEAQKAYHATLKGKITSWKASAKTRNIAWSITSEYLSSMPMKCHYTGVELTFISCQINTVSLDRLDSEKGYEPGNVVFCCEKINKMKQDLSVDEFVRLCKVISKHLDNSLQND